MKERQFLSPATRRWLLAFVLVWALSCAAVWTLAVVYLILFFVVFQLIVFPVLMFGLCASAGWHADLGPFRWLMPMVLSLVYSIWPLNMLVASQPAPPDLSYLILGAVVSYLGLIVGTIVRRVRANSKSSPSA